MRNFNLKFNLMLLLVAFSANSFAQSAKAEKGGWLLGAQSYTFHQFTFAETLDRMQKLGLKYVEIYYGQKLGDGLPGTMDYKMDKPTQLKVLKLAKSKGVKIVAGGVIICENNGDWDKLFEFSKAMGIKTITSEPALNQLDYVGKLADKFNIDVAFHNHPKPSTYWDPAILMKALEGRSKHLGSCADVGHWTRMGVDPVQALKTCEGRIKSLHFKDVDKAGADSHDTIWGTGVCNVEAMLKELKRQNFKGLFSIEYEYHEENPDPEIKESIKYFDQIVDHLF